MEIIIDQLVRKNKNKKKKHNTKIKNQKIFQTSLTMSCNNSIGWKKEKQILDYYQLYNCDKSISTET